MKKLITILLLLPILCYSQIFGIISSNGGSSTSAIQLVGRNIYFFGDSYTAGQGSANVKYTTAFANHFDAIENNFGIGGEVLQHTNCWISSYLDRTTFPTYNAATFGVLYIALGFNDIRINNGSYTPSGYQATLDTTIQYAHNTKGIPYNKIAIVSPYFAGTNTIYPTGIGLCSTTTSADIPRHQAYLAAVQAECNLYGCIYVDTYSPWAQIGISGLSGYYASDSIHPNDAGYTMLAQNMWATSAFNYPAGPSYISGTTAITFTSTTNLTNTSGVWAATTTTGGYGNEGLSSLKIPASQDGWVAFKVAAIDGYNAVFGITTSNALTGYGGMQAGAYVPGGVHHQIYRDDNSSVQPIANTIADIGSWIRINRTGSTITLQQSADGASWNTIYTYGFSSTLALYIVCDIYGTGGKLYYPQGFNVQ